MRPFSKRNDSILDSIKFYEKCLNHILEVMALEALNGRYVHDIYHEDSPYIKIVKLCKENSLKADENMNASQDSEFLTIAKEWPDENAYTKALKEVKSRHDEKLKELLPTLVLEDNKKLRELLKYNEKLRELVEDNEKLRELLEYNENNVGGYDKYIKKKKMKTKKGKQKREKK